jgi:hypothetical protein
MNIGWGVEGKGGHEQIVSRQPISFTSIWTPTTNQYSNPFQSQIVFMNRSHSFPAVKYNANGVTFSTPLSKCPISPFPCRLSWPFYSGPLCIGYPLFTTYPWLSTHPWIFWSSFTVTSTKGIQLPKSGLKPVCNVYGNLKSENSQDYAQKPQRNCTFMNSASGYVWSGREGTESLGPIVRWDIQAKGRRIWKKRYISEGLVTSLRTVKFNT